MKDIEAKVLVLPCLSARQHIEGGEVNDFLQDHKSE